MDSDKIEFNVYLDSGDRRVKSYVDKTIEKNNVPE